ncbi:hypothetical protein TWF730_007941 [Orbilia blumenaviensis]|uniref:Uncharacterized protein n=1 Tax=Orbilia blumenaviensis TaxID=1796055 RepID=A0AAV9VBW4_9PEZI
MQLLNILTFLGMAGAALAVPNPEPQNARQCTTYSNVFRTVTIAPTITIPVAIVAIDRTVDCGRCNVVVVRTRVATIISRRVPPGQKVKTVIRKSTATTYHPVCRTQTPDD